MGVNNGFDVLKTWLYAVGYAGLFVALIGAMATIGAIVDVVRWVWVHE